MTSILGNNGSGTSQDNPQNIYRIGDYVYFETSGCNPLAIRRIEELNKTQSGNVEARVMIYYRRADLPPSLIPQADKHHWEDLDEHEDDSDDEDGSRAATREERFLMKTREVFPSRSMETLPANQIRGKCSVTLFSEVETYKSYTDRPDSFFYALVYDPQQKTLLADRGEIRIGSSYQATVPSVLGINVQDSRSEKNLEDKIWNGESAIQDGEVEKFLIIARSVGTFARALDCSSSIKQPSLHMSAAAASRDVTLFRAHDILHSHDYDITSALKSLVPNSGPLLCRDEMEDWSASEANLFEEAIEKYGKVFTTIKKDYLPWKSMKNIIEFFFMWKTTDRYVQQKRIKAIEAESKLKQVYVPPYVNKAYRLTGSNGEIIVRGKDSETYPNNKKYSWKEYKRYGTFSISSSIDDSFILDKSAFSSATAAKLAQLRPGLIIEPGSPAAVKAGAGKTRAAFFLRTTPLTRAARRVCKASFKLEHYARKPGTPIDMKAVKIDAQTKMMGMSERNIRIFNTFFPKTRVNMSVVVGRLGQTEIAEQEWLILTPKSALPRPAKEFFPRPSKRSDGSYIYDRVPGSYNAQPQMLYKKRAYEEKTPEVVAPKMARSDGRQHIPNVVPPKGRVATLTRIQGGHKQVISWMDAPDDVFYKATPSTKKIRKRLSVVNLRKAARKPFKKVISLPPVVPV